MDLLTDELRRQLPMIHKHRNLGEEEFYMIYAKFFAVSSGVAFYVAEGELRKGEYTFWGFLITRQFKFPSRFQITLGRLQSADWVGGDPCQRDETFQPDRWGAIRCTLPDLR